MSGSINSQLAPKPVRVDLPNTPAPAPTTSTGKNVAIGAAAVAGTSLATLLIVSAATGWGISKVLDKAWDKLKSL